MMSLMLGSPLMKQRMPSQLTAFMMPSSFAFRSFMLALLSFRFDHIGAFPIMKWLMAALVGEFGTASLYLPIK